MLTKSILLISGHNFGFCSLTAKVFSLFSILVFLSNIMLCKKFLHFSIIVRRWFDDQDFIVVFNFFSIFEKSWKYGKDFFACFVDLEKVYCDCLSNFGGFCRRMALMVGCYMPLRHSKVLTGVSWLSKWQTIKAVHIRVKLRQGCVLFLLFSLFP